MYRHKIKWGAVTLYLSMAVILLAGVVVATNNSDHPSAIGPSATKLSTTTEVSAPKVANKTNAQVMGPTKSPTVEDNTTGKSIRPTTTSNVLPETLPDRAQLLARLQSFVKAYYTLESSDTPSSRQERLAPYTSITVLKTIDLTIYTNDILDKYLDKMKSPGKAAVIGNLQTDKISDGMVTVIGPNHHVTIIMPVSISLYKPDGSVLTSYTLPAHVWPSSDWTYTNDNWTMTRFNP